MRRVPAGPPARQTNISDMNDMTDTHAPTALSRRAGALARIVSVAAHLSVIAAAFALPHASLASDAPSFAPSAARRSELIVLVRQDCGSCHGLLLKGGLGPALLPENLAGKESDSLVETIQRGRPGTAMPPWQRFFTQAEAEWIVNQLIKGFPNE